MTKTGTDAYIAAVTEQLNGIRHVSPGAAPGCESCGLPHGDHNDMIDEIQTLDEGFFSKSQCDSCGSTFGGQRYPAHGDLDGETVHLDICADCLMMHANGELPEEWRQHP